MSSWKKKGETHMVTDVPSGGAAAVVIGLITVVLVMYIIFLPAEERADLLNDDDAPLSARANKTLLSIPVGTLDFTGDTSLDHPIPNVLLIERRNAEVFGEYNPFVVRNGWFTTQKEVLEFTLNTLELTDNVALSFRSPRRDGTLTIILNGAVVFEGEPQSVNVGPVELPQDLLAKNNVLELKVSGPGLAFWKVNQFNIEDMQVVGDVTDEKSQEALNTIVISDAELREMERVRLDYFPGCLASSVGTLDVFVNNRLIASAVPDCDSPDRLELDKEDFDTGKNTIFFRVSEGSLRLEQIRLRVDLREPVPFIEYFDVSDEDMGYIRKGADATLRLTFVEDSRVKRGSVNVNDRTFSLRESGTVFTQDVSRFLTPGENYIQITPENTLHVVKAEILLEG